MPVAIYSTPDPGPDASRRATWDDPGPAQDREPVRCDIFRSYRSDHQTAAAASPSRRKWSQSRRRRGVTVVNRLKPQTNVFAM